MSDITTHVFKALRLITMQTDDPMNAYRVIMHYSGLDADEVSRLGKTGLPSLLNPKANNNEFWNAIKDQSLMIIEDGAMLSDKIDWTEILSGCRDHETTIVVVNPSTPLPLAFDVGFLEVPREVVRDYLEQFVPDDHLDEMMSACAGLSIRQVTDIGKIATSMYHEFSPHTAEKVRAAYFQSVQGLSRLNLHDEFYAPSDELTTWIDLNRVSFAPDVHKILRPRGIIATGTAGTGKTSGARHVAREFGVPCYLMRTEEIYDKYVGGSGKNLARVLAQAESFAPCVLVMDEVEKLFRSDGGESSGTTSKLLAQILWWLQEHDSMIITVMTTNDLPSIPPELYRAGRLDCIMEFGAMDNWNDVIDFAGSYGDYLVGITGINPQGIYPDGAGKHLKPYFDNQGGRLTHSEVIQFIINGVKKSMQNKLIENP